MASDMNGWRYMVLGMKRYRRRGEDESCRKLYFIDAERERVGYAWLLRFYEK